MNKVKVEALKLWFESYLPLEVIGDKLQKLGFIAEHCYDYENIYEWIEGEDIEEGYCLNLSRKHADFEDYEDEPIHLMVLYQSQAPTKAFIEKLGQRLFKELGTQVNLGYIEHQGNDVYAYRALHTYTAAQG